MSLLATHPRFGFPRYLHALGFDPNNTGGGTGNGSTPPGTPGADDPPPGSDDPPAQEDKTDWKAEARKWEARAKENSKARETSETLQQRVDALAPLEKLAEALGATNSKDPSEVEKLTDRVTKHEEELAAERTARWRAEVGHEKGLTAEQAARLVGTSREELLADADALLALFPKPAEEKRPLVVSRSGTGESDPPKGSISAGRDMYKPRAKPSQ